MKWFALQRGVNGPEPVIFHDDAPAKSHKMMIIDGTLREIPPKLERLSLPNLAKVMERKR